MNIAISLALLVYLLTTAGLGIFWVANQQLPVFDWHYVFGYATLVLVALHLGFNLPLVWRQLRRPSLRRVVAERDASPATSRRRTLSIILALSAATAVGYALGLRQGRTQLRIDAQHGSFGDTATAVIESFHRATAHSRHAAVRRAPNAGWDAQSMGIRAPAGTARVALGAPAPSPEPAVGRTTLGVLLWHVAGITERRPALNLRAAPSSGALFATELYAVTRGIDGLPAGVWQYDAEGHALLRIPAAIRSAAQVGTGPDLDDAPVWLLATAVWARSGRKYGDRTYRYVLADLGHALENLRGAAVALGWQAVFALRFDEARAAALIGRDETNEGVLALVALYPGDAIVPAPSAWHAAVGWTPAALLPAADPTRAAHRAASLRAKPDSRSPSLGVVDRASIGSGGLLPIDVPLPPPLGTDDDVLGLIARRRSHRRYSDRPVALAALASVLDAMLRRHSPVYSSAVRIDVLTPAVDGLPVAVWRYDPQRHGLQRRTDGGTKLRERAQRAALDQGVIGDAAAVFVLSIDWPACQTDAVGAARGYRHAMLEAGLIGERLYLAAGGLGLAACAVGAFYDDDATALVAAGHGEAWVVHFAALGVPA